MDKIRVIGGIALLAIVASCSNPAKEFKTELQAIDSLQSMMSSYQAALDSVNMEDITAKATEVDRQYKYIIENYKDSTNRHFWVNDMSYYKGVMKTFTHFVKGEPELREELVESTNKLQTLENSIADGKLKREEVDQYLKDETMAAQHVQMSYAKIVPTLKDMEMIYEDYKPKMDSIETFIRSSAE